MAKLDDSREKLAARQKTLRVDILSLANRIGRVLRPSDAERYSVRYGLSYTEAMDLLDVIEDRLLDWAKELDQ